MSPDAYPEGKGDELGEEEGFHEGKSWAVVSLNAKPEQGNQGNENAEEAGVIAIVGGLGGNDGAGWDSGGYPCCKVGGDADLGRGLEREGEAAVEFTRG